MFLAGGNSKHIIGVVSLIHAFLDQQINMKIVQCINIGWVYIEYPICCNSYNSVIFGIFGWGKNSKHIYLQRPLL